LGKPKAVHKVKDWAAHIISACRQDDETSDEEALKVMKVFLYYNSICKMLMYIL
jgi:hypothetical protein